MKTVCIYHSIDLDGWMSAAIVKHWFITEHDKNDNMFYDVYNNQNSNKSIEVVNKDHSKDELVFIGYNYGQPVPNLDLYDRIIMCDISFPVEEMTKLSNKLIWIDHHISAILDNPETAHLKYEGIRDTKFSACELTWKYFFPNEEMPEIVRLLGRYDCFGHKGTEEEQKVLEFQYGARQCISNYEEAYNRLQQNLSSNSIIKAILQSGENIYQYLCTEAKQVYKNGFEIILEEFIPYRVAENHFNEAYVAKRKFICINKERFNPINFGIDYHKDGYEGVASFFYSNGEWNFSLYNDNGQVDCSVIAKQYGGGGHKGASGFRVKDLSLIIK